MEREETVIEQRLCRFFVSTPGDLPPSCAQFTSLVLPPEVDSSFYLRIYRTRQFYSKWTSEPLAYCPTRLPNKLQLTSTTY